MTAPVQLGEELEIGIGGYTYSGWIVEEAEKTDIAEIEEIRSEDDDVCTKIIKNPGKRVTINCIGEAGSDLESVNKGDTVTVNSVAMMVEDVTQRRSRGVIRATLVLVKEDSMTYT